MAAGYAAGFNQASDAFAKAMFVLASISAILTLAAVTKVARSKHETDVTQR